MSTPFYMFTASRNALLAVGEALHTKKESDRATATTLFHGGIDGFFASEILRFKRSDELVSLLFEQRPSRLECTKTKKKLICPMRCNSPLPLKFFLIFFFSLKNPAKMAREERTVEIVDQTMQQVAKYFDEGGPRPSDRNLLALLRGWFLQVGFLFPSYFFIGFF